MSPHPHFQGIPGEDDADVGLFPQHRAAEHLAPGEILRQRLQPRIIDVEHRGVRTLEDLCLGPGDGVHGAKAFQVNRAHCGDHPNLGRDPSAQAGDLPRTVRAHLGHEDLGTGGEVLVDGARQAHHVVEAGGAGHHRPSPGAQVPHVFLGGGLAVRAGHGYHYWAHRDQLGLRSSHEAPSQ